MFFSKEEKRFVEGSFMDKTAFVGKRKKRITLGNGGSNEQAKPLHRRTEEKLCINFTTQSYCL